MRVRILRFQVIKLNSYAFLTNHINLAISSKKRWVKFKCTKKILRLLFIFKKLGLIYSYVLLKVFNNNVLVKVSPFFYRGSAFFKKIRLISTSSKKFYVNLKTLKIISTSLNDSILILSTSRGLITHKEALKLHLGGTMLFLL